MLQVYQRGETATLRMESRNTAGALTDPGTSIQVEAWDPSGNPYITTASMTKESTGIYYYDQDVAADAALGCYRIKYTTVNSNRTTKSDDYILIADPASPPMGWSVMTLADQMRAEMDQNADAAGGRIPDRIAKIVREKGLWLFDKQDWLFRVTPATLSVAAGDTEVSMPSDFKELHSNSMRVDDASAYRMLWTENPSYWQAAKAMIGNEASSNAPRIACLYYTGGAWKARIWPAADQAYDYDFWYVKASPWSGTPIADNIALSPTYWPEDFDEGWYALCAYHIYSRFRGDDAWKGFKSEFEKWLRDHDVENNETISDNLEPIEDVMTDFQVTASSLQAGLPGGNIKWYGSV